MDNKELRKFIKEIISEIELNELDILVKKTKEKMLSNKKDWDEEKNKLKKNLKELLKHINSDSHQESIEMIDDVISQLKDWKKKIKNFL